MLIKEKIKLGNSDINLKFPLSRNGEFTGYQQEIDNYTTIRSEQSINDSDDGEVRRFGYLPTISNPRLDFAFRTSDGNFSKAFFPQGITLDDIKSQNDSYLNSYFIIDMFDTYRTENQTKLATTYLTKLYNNTENYDTDDANLKLALSIYDINFKNEIFYLNVPISFINGRTSGNIIVYFRFTFYNAKTGKIVLFNTDPSNQSTNPRRMYVSGLVYFGSKFWYLSRNIQNITNLYELYNSEEYVQRYNDTFENFENQQPTYPAGNTFNSSDGTYETNN